MTKQTQMVDIQSQIRLVLINRFSLATSQQKTIGMKISFSQLMAKSRAID